VLTLPDTARCRSLRPATCTDDMRSRPRRAVGLSEVQEGRKAPGSDVAPACPALAPAAAAAGKLNAKLKSDFRCYPDNGHAATEMACQFGATSGLMQCSKQHRYSITSSELERSDGDRVRPSVFAVLRLIVNSNLVG
jgi:hypothetical protein